MNKYDVMFIFAFISAVIIPYIAITLAFPWYMLISSFVVSLMLVTGIIAVIVEGIAKMFASVLEMHLLVQYMHRDEERIIKFMAVTSAVFLTVQLLYHLLL